MSNSGTHIERSERRPAVRWLAPFIRCRRGAIAPMTALMLVPIVGGIAYSVELGSWTYMQRSMQNAADSAALSAATINSATGSTSQNEARAAARKFGFVNGQNGVTVTANTTTCPAAFAVGSVCYEATIATTMPYSFSGILGNSGNQAISARAVAIAVGGGGGGPAPTNSVCVWSFTNLQTNGTPDANLAGCSVMSNGNMTCTGNGLHADYAVAGGSISGSCAQNSSNHLSGQTNLPSDTYAGLANSGIPTNPCSSYPQAPNNGTVPVSNRISGTISADRLMCGDIQLTGNVTITGNARKIVIYSGRLDLNRFTMKTAAGASATLIFSGTSGAYRHYPMDGGNGNGSGVLEIEAPSGANDAFKGVAVYQDPRLGNSGVDFTYAGNKPAWKITGVIYLPKASVTFSGVVDKADDGSNCQVLIVNSATINGTGKIIGDVTGCAAAGVTPPVAVVGSATAERVKLVL